MRQKEISAHAKKFAVAAKDQLAESGLAIFHHTRDTFAAMPEFFGTQLASSKAPHIFSHTARLFCSDILPIMMIHSIYAWMAASNNPDEEKNNSIAAQIGLCLIGTVATLLIFRQKLQFLARTTVLSIAYPSAFDKASNETRHKLDAVVCKDCTPARILKGEIRTILVYFAQLITLMGLQYLPYAGWLLALCSRILLMGQLISEYRLASDHICDRHRTEYYHQHPEFFFTLGFMHYFATQFIASQAQWMPGVKRSHVEGMIGTIMMLYFVGLAHHMRFPRAVKKATRHFYEPLIITRAFISFSMDLLIPGFKKIFDTMAERKKEKLSWKNFRDCVELLLQYSALRWAIKLMVPQLYRDFKHFSKDPIMQHYWPTVFEMTATHFKKIIKLQKPALLIDDAVMLHATYGVPLQRVAAVVGVVMAVLAPPLAPLGLMANTNIIALFAKPFIALCRFRDFQTNAHGAVEMVGDHSRPVAELMQLFAGVPKGVFIIAIVLLRNKEFMSDLEAIRKKLEMVANEYRSEQGCKEFDVIDAPKKPKQVDSDAEFDDAGKLLNAVVVEIERTMQRPVSVVGFDSVERADAEVVAPDCEWTASPIAKTPPAKKSVPSGNGGALKRFGSVDWDDCGHAPVAQSAPVFR